MTRIGLIVTGAEALVDFRIFCRTLEVWHPTAHLYVFTDSVTPVVANSTWVRNGSIYLLTGCPAGYTLRSTLVTGSPDLQQCQQCLASQYILNPNTDACQTCPRGLTCSGTDSALQDATP
jgi:hypothetical protein